VPSSSLTKSGAGPCPAGPTPPPTPLHRLRWIRRCRGLPGRIHVAATFPARSAVPLAGSRLPDWIRRCRGLPDWIRRSPSILPLLFCRGRGHHDRRRCVRCCRPPWRGSLTPGRSKKQEARPAGALLLCRPRRSLTLERRPLPKNRLLLRVSRPRPPRLRYLSI
jgi:hypothetical protein